jgi:hypothetical protein
MGRQLGQPGKIDIGTLGRQRGSNQRRIIKKGYQMRVGLEQYIDQQSTEQSCQGKAIAE